MKINTDLKYPLNNPDGKVSIRYYLNTKLKPELSDDGIELYPLYFQLIVKRQKTLNRSHAKTNKMSIDDFEKIKDVANSKKIEDIGKALIPLVSDYLPNNEKDDNILNMCMPILIEKNLVYDVVADLKPFDRTNFDVKEFNENFEIYNSEIKSTISTVFRDSIRFLLEKHTNKDNSVLANIFLKIIDWNNANAYDLWFVLKDKFEQVDFFMMKYPYCFQIISGVNVNNLPESDIWIIDFFAEQTYQSIVLGLRYAYDIGFKGRSPMYDNPLFDPICSELKNLFFGK
jgi:hypothetical protein